MTDQIRFEDGAAYERYMGVWSRLVGDEFLDWLAAQPGCRWLDVGCGNGAFTERIVQRCAPASVDGVDPSDAQLAYARQRPALSLARFKQGDAMALPFPDNAFDVAVMPLVIFFVPDPAIGVAEMARVVRAGGLVTAYGWDIAGGGFPYVTLQTELRAAGVSIPMPPSPDASSPGTLRQLWNGAGLKAVQTREIEVERTFGSVDDYWDTVQGSASMGAKLAAMSPGDRATLETRLRASLTADSSGRVTVRARANAVRGVV